MRFTIAFALVLAVTLFLRPDWSSVLIRVVASGVDMDLWRGYLANGPFACGCLSGTDLRLAHTMMMTSSQESAVATSASSWSSPAIDDDDALSYKPIDNGELARRRFCIVNSMQVPTIQTAIVDGLQSVVSWLLSVSTSRKGGGIVDMRELCFGLTAAMAQPINIVKVLREWKASEKESEEKPDSAPSAVSLAYKIYDSGFKTQLAPLAYATLFAGRGLGPSGFTTELVTSKERARHVVAWNVSTSPDQRIVKLFPALAQRFIADPNLVAVRVLATADQMFSRRGFPLWNILPEETLVITAKRL